MLALNEQAIIAEVIQNENAEEMILTLINRFASKSVDNCRVIIRNNDRLIDKMMELQQKQRMEALQAAYMAVLQREFDITDYKTYFASMVPVCQVLFPLGTADGECLALKKYFDEFVNLLHNKKAFDIERDKSWAENYGYLDYLILVLNNTCMSTANKT